MMPVDSLLVSVAVVAMFVVFAGVLWWGDARTSSSSGQKTAGRGGKHRAF